ncbi:exocyst complex component 3-like protein 4 [Scophthalmus maximus]|uniref:exocyst complex component 3-like protein 4 n=1 Tax=Scophthalmus maximus TaxID=52904 RepID=UPI0015E0CF3D|nr:exocyst complex component 3-like protein 4 [Scophthalmus maximus]
MRRLIAKLKGKSKAWKVEQKSFLIKNNNNVPDGHDQAGERPDAPSPQNTFNTHEEQRLRRMPEELAVFLNVAPDATCATCEDGSLDVERLIQRSACKHFPKPPAHLDKNLRKHLLDVQEAVLHELLRLGPLLEPEGLMGCLLEHYHCQTFDHLHCLLQNVTSTKNSFVLMHWVLHTYQSEEFLGHPDLQEMDTIKKVDDPLVNEWLGNAREKVLENLQKEVRGSLEKILQIAIGQQHCDNEEAYVRLHVDTIQCINAMHSEAQKICSELSGQLQEACFKELLIFVRRYTAEQTEALQKKAKMDKPETIHFLKTLTACKKLKQYVQTKGKGIEPSLLKEMVEMLENMEACALDLLMGIVAGIAKSHLTQYFKSDSRRFLLFRVVEEYFPKLSYGVDEQKKVMDEAYELIARIYVEHLVQNKQSVLKKRWSPNVGQTVAEDAKHLHTIISHLAPGVQQFNLILLKVTEILECNSIEALKITVASMQAQSLTKSEDGVFLITLLRWKGLNNWEVKEVLDALPPDLQPRPDPDDQQMTNTSWYSCFIFW